MKKTIENEKGYALLVVLFLIVFIFTVAAVFISGSLSNAKQGQIVDQNHLSVVAAEMGIDYYIGKINNEERIIQQEALESIRDDLETFNSCGGKQDPKKPGCESVLPIEIIKDNVRSNYLNGIKGIGGVRGLVKDIKESDSTNIKLYSHETAKSEDSPFSYKVDEDETDLKVKEEIINIKIGVNGKSKASKPKLLTVDLSFAIPKFIVKKTVTENQGESTYNTSDIYDFFKNRGDYKYEVGCTAQNGKCSPGKFYSDGNKSTNNPNNQGGLTWVHNGYLDVKNMNQFNFTLIVKSLEVGNMNKMNGKLVLLGNENPKGQIVPDKNFSVSFQNSGKICVNIDGYSKWDIEKIKFGENDPYQASRVYFYSSKENPDWPSTATNSHKVSGSLVDFVNTCIEQPIIEMEGDTPDVVQYEVFESALDLLVDVTY